jgi:alpha-N-acetylglucosamine transferase
MQLSNRLTPRRVCAACPLGLIIVLLLFVARHSTLSQHLPDLAPYIHHEASKTNPDFGLAESCASIQQPAVESGIQWSDFAYTQYVTDPIYLCNSLMILEALHRLHSKADRIMLYPEDWKVPTDNGSTSDSESRILAQARDRYGTKLIPVRIQAYENNVTSTWQDSYTKLLAFNQTQYKRVISLDSDATLRQVSIFRVASVDTVLTKASTWTSCSY